MAELDRRIDIEYPVEAVDSHGEPIATWTTLATGVPARFMPLGGAEQELAQQRFATQRARFRIRWRDDLTHKMRVVYETRYYQIVDFEEDAQGDRHQYLRVTCQQIAAA